MRITDKVLPYPLDESLSFQIPQCYDSTKRFLLGHLGEKLLVAICTNQSAVSGKESDRTVNAIIRASQKLGIDEWVADKLYPKRGTNSLEVAILSFDNDLAEENCDVIVNFLQEQKII